MKMVPSESCPGCGFVWDDISSEEIPARTASATDAFVDVISSNGANVGVRPSPERWSILEYGSHMRDVFLSIRERIVKASIEDEAIGQPIYRDERVNLGFYKLDEPEETARELTASSKLFVRTFLALPDGDSERRFAYSPISPQKVTILWAAAQALHESEHHLGDVRENLRLLNA